MLSERLDANYTARTFEGGGHIPVHGGGLLLKVDLNHRLRSFPSEHHRTRHVLSREMANREGDGHIGSWQAIITLLVFIATSCVVLARRPD